MTSRVVFGTKYGKIIKARPVSSGTTVFCLLPYTKKPSPIEPKSKPQRSVDVFIATAALGKCAAVCRMLAIYPLRVCSKTLLGVGR